jgi:hypothetical protein
MAVAQCSPFVDPRLARPIFFSAYAIISSFQHDHCHHHDGSHLLLWVIFSVRHAGAALEIAIATPEPLFVAKIFLMQKLQRPYFCDCTLSEKLASRSLEAY